MAPSRFAATLAITILAVGWTGPLRAQEPLQPAKALSAIERIQRLLDEDRIETKDLPKEMPLAKLLDAVAKKLPKEMRVTLCIDKAAFGNKAAEVAATPVVLGSLPKKVRLRKILELAIAKTKVKTDYRIGPGEIAITTPERSLYAGSYDVRDILAKPEFPGAADRGWKNMDKNGQFRKQVSSQRLLRLVQLLVSSTGVMSDARNHEAVEIENGARLLIRANPARHALISSLLGALVRWADVAVVLQVRLYEVDQVSYKTIASGKRIFGKDLEEEELIFLGQKKPPKRDPKREAQWQALEKALAKEKPIEQGEVKLDNGQQAVVLSWQKVGMCRPALAEVRKRDDPPQAFLEGVSFLATTRVDATRRYVRLMLTEKAVELRGLGTEKTPAQFRELEPLSPDANDCLDSELPALDETIYAQALEIPDGGTLRLPVHYRPASARAKNRWWILSITPRIWIEEEERQIRNGNVPPPVVPRR
jgi:hypothetical protein